MSKKIKVFYTVTQTFQATLDEEDVRNLNDVVDPDYIEDVMRQLINHNHIFCAADSSHIIWEYVDATGR